MEQRTLRARERGDAAQHYMRQWREARGLSLGEMQRMIPFSKSTMSRIENGLRPYYQDILEAYARVIGCQPGDLVNRPPGGPEELWTILSDCDSHTLAQILSITKVLIKQSDQS
jgi:transcriptional regulator with XRE-family HTH domain